VGSERRERGKPTEATAAAAVGSAGGEATAPDATTASKTPSG
jgi:hypothetical protein